MIKKKCKTFFNMHHSTNTIYTPNSMKQSRSFDDKGDDDKLVASVP